MSILRRKIKMSPNYIRLMKITKSDALCAYNRNQNAANKTIFNILNDAYWAIEESYRKHKKIADSVEVLETVLKKIMARCEKLRLIYKTLETRKALEKYKAVRVALSRLLNIRDEMLLEVEESRAR